MMILVIALVFIYREEITNYVTNNIIKQEKQEELKYNDYAKKQDYKYVLKEWWLGASKLLSNYAIAVEY